MGIPLPCRILEDHHQSPAGEYHFAALIPHPLLAPLVLQMFHMRGDLAYQREKVMPEGDVVVLFNLGDTQGLVNSQDPQDVTPFDGAFISGLQQRYVITEALKESHMMGVRLTPLGAYQLLGLPMSELCDQVVEAEWIVRDWGWLAGRLADCPDVHSRFSMLEEELLRRLVAGPEPIAVIRAGFLALQSSRGQVRIGPLSRRLEVSARHLNQRFTEQVGVSPKAYARLLRFRHALYRLMEPETPLTDIALDCGYYDQSHFNREFRRFAGATPAEYRAHAGPDGSSIVVE